MPWTGLVVSDKTDKYINNYISEFKTLAFQSDAGEGMAAINLFKSGLE